MRDGSCQPRELYWSLIEVFFKRSGDLIIDIGSYMQMVSSIITLLFSMTGRWFTCYIHDPFQSVRVYTMPYKIQPIRMQESRCQFISIPLNLPIDHCNSTPNLYHTQPVHCALLATVFSMAWYKIVMQPFLMVYHGISHESLVLSRYTHPAEGSCVYRENTIDSWDIPQYIT